MERARVRIWFPILAFLLFPARSLHPQQTDDLQATTNERLQVEPWWPTLSTSSLSAFAGSNACTRCHTEETAHQPSTSMQRAATVATDATLLREKTPQSFVSAPFTYALTSSDAGLEYSVSDGTHRLSRMLAWVMGAGALGNTFLYQTDGQWFQSEASFYRNPSKLDITTGLEEPGHDLAEALGKPLSSADARRCFNCHTVHSTTAEGFNPQKAEAGLGCEACHGPGREHVQAMTAAKGSVGGGAHASGALVSAVFNPAKLSPSDANDFCGACHRTFADVNFSTNQAQNTAVVRFQPYRLEESKCWRAGPDARLTCVACHNPHESLNRNVASYDRHCLQCHATVAGSAPQEHAGKVCPKAKSDCVSCHMPKLEIASMHGEFTDHFIRVVKKDEAFPR